MLRFTAYRLFEKLAGSQRQVRTTTRRQTVFAFEGLEPRFALSRQASIDGSISYLNSVMDQYHDRIPVSEDLGSAGNRFHALCELGNVAGAVSVQGGWSVAPHQGATAIRAEFVDVPGGNWGGYYFQNGVLPSGARAPLCNFGTTPNAGVDLSAADKLTFWARGEQGGERVEFFLGGVGRDAASGIATTPYPDSSPRFPHSAVTTLSTTWQRYEIPLSGLDLRYVLGGFAWVTSDNENPGGAVFYLDDIQYEIPPAAQADRLNSPRFLRSYTTADVQPDVNDANKDDDVDFVLRNLAFTYDNALAVLGYLADGRSDSLRRAQLIGDAFVYAYGNDRSRNQLDTVYGSTNHALRTAYTAGDIALPAGWTPNGLSGTVPVPGFYDELLTRQFYEIEYKFNYTGNNAWAMIALLKLYQWTSQTKYLDTALSIGQFMLSTRLDSGTYQGFLGGHENPDSDAPSLAVWASTEHNLDLVAAFNVAFDVTGDPVWSAAADHARQFVEAMWDDARGLLLTGTLTPMARNALTGQLPLDVQAWSILAMPGWKGLHPDLLSRVKSTFFTTYNGISGYDFNEDRDGVWFEGTAHMAVAYAVAGNDAEAQSLRQTLYAAQWNPALTPGPGIPATNREGLSTGFDFKYFQRDHIATAAWNIFAQLGFNPYYDLFPMADLNADQTVSIVDAIRLRNLFGTPPSASNVLAGDLNGDARVDLKDLRVLAAQFGRTANLTAPFGSSPFAENTHQAMAIAKPARTIVVATRGRKRPAIAQAVDVVLDLRTARRNFP